MTHSDAPMHAQRAWRSPRALAVFLTVTAAVLAADLALKHWAFEHVAGRPVRLVVGENNARPGVVPYHSPDTLIPHVLSLQLTVNPGAVFGIGAGNRWAFVLISLAAAGVIGYLFGRSRPRAWVSHLALGLILAGALGNLHDRLLYAGVRDMLKLFPGVLMPLGLSWPGGDREVYPWIFNLADAALVVGIVLVLMVTWRTGERTADDEAGEPGDHPATDTPRPADGSRPS